MIQLLDLAVRAHGGLDAWRSIKSIELKASLNGELLRIKGHPEGIIDVLIHIEAREPALTITPFGRPDFAGHFLPDRVWLEGNGSGKEQELRNPRRSFEGHSIATPWTKLQELYFLGYAMWNYLATPFLFASPGFETKELGPHAENGETWRRLAVKYPEHIPTHCAEQTFYFGEDGLLRRLDYFVEVVNDAAAHYCYDHKNFNGFMVPTLRRVVGRSPEGSKPSGPTSVLVQFSDIKFS